MIKIDMQKCDLCGTCISVCHENCIMLTNVLSIDSSVCVSCCKCVNVCPYAALRLEQE